MTKYTINDIARLAGVSPAAVSIAINGKKGISEKTRSQILKIVEVTNYYPNPNSKRLLSKRTNNITIMMRKDLPAIDQLFYTELNASILNVCCDLPCNLIFTSVKKAENNTVVLPEVIRARDTDGVIVYGNVEKIILDEIQKFNIPIVVLDNCMIYNEYLSVSVDYYKAAYTATKHLIDLGHRDISYIGCSDLQNFNLVTFNGFQNAIAEKDLALQANRIQFNVFDEDSLRACVSNSLAGASHPTALFCVTDLYAIYAISYLRKIGIRVPEDISVIGIDDIILSKFYVPALTTVKVDKEKMGRLGFELLQKKIHNEPCESIVLPSCDLVIRESTAPLPAGTPDVTCRPDREE